MARQKEFDEAAVLRKAMMFFWRNGYEKTSIQDLVDYMEIHRRSMYDTFGDKRALYEKALRAFEDMTKKLIEREINAAPSARQALRAMFEMTVLPREGKPPGCLIVNTAIELSSHDEEIAKEINRSFLETEKLIRDVLEKGQLAGEFSAQLDLDSTALFLHNAFVGLRVLAKTSDDQEKLQQIINRTLAVLN